MIQSATFCKAAYALIATANRIHVWGRFDHKRPGFDVEYFLAWSFIATLLAGAALLVVRMQRREGRGFVSNSPRKLFRELCVAHGLTMGDRRLLRRLARVRGLTNSALIFIEPHHFDPATLPESMQIKARRLQRLRALLFDEQTAKPA